MVIISEYFSDNQDKNSQINSEIVTQRKSYEKNLIDSNCTTQNKISNNLKITSKHTVPPHTTLVCKHIDNKILISKSVDPEFTSSEIKADKVSQRESYALNSRTDIKHLSSSKYISQISNAINQNSNQVPLNNSLETKNGCDEKCSSRNDLVGRGPKSNITKIKPSTSFTTSLTRKNAEETKLSDSSHNSPTRTKIGQQFQAMKEKLNLSLNSPINQSIESLYSLDHSRESNVTSSNPFERFYKHYRNKIIQDELNLLPSHVQDGIYVTPSIKSLQVWFGVIFIRTGPYEEAVFHFTLYFRDNYPDTRPVFRFKSKIFHPQIDVKGTLNLDVVYGEKTYVPVWKIFRYTRSCFYHLNIQQSSNKEAEVLFKTDLDKFKARCRASVLDSMLEYEEQKNGKNIESENPFRCKIYDDEFLDGVKHAVLWMNREALKKVSVVDWAKNNLGRMLNNIGTPFYNDHTDDYNLDYDNS